MHIQIHGLQKIHGSVYNNTGIYAYILVMNPHSPPRQLESLTFYNKFVYFTEYFSVNFLTVQGTAFKEDFYIICYIDFMNSFSVHCHIIIAVQ